MALFNTKVGAAVLAAGLALGSQASAHYVVSGETPVPALSPGESIEFTVNCPSHLHYVVSGGVENNDQLNGAQGPLIVTASYPKTTSSWAVEVTNDSGRTTSVVEARLTLYALCGYSHH
jgi:hypothetical protein